MWTGGGGGGAGADISTFSSALWSLGPWNERLGKWKKFIHKYTGALASVKVVTFTVSYSFPVWTKQNKASRVAGVGRTQLMEVMYLFLCENSWEHHLKLKLKFWLNLWALVCFSSTWPTFGNPWPWGSSSVALLNYQSWPPYKTKAWTLRRRGFFHRSLFSMHQMSSWFNQRRTPEPSVSGDRGSCQSHFV